MSSNGASNCYSSPCKGYKLEGKGYKLEGEGLQKANNLMKMLKGSDNSRGEDNDLASMPEGAQSAQQQSSPSSSSSSSSSKQTDIQACLVRKDGSQNFGVLEGSENNLIYFEYHHIISDEQDPDKDNHMECALCLNTEKPTLVPCQSYPLNQGCTKLTKDQPSFPCGDKVEGEVEEQAVLTSFSPNCILVLHLPDDSKDKPTLCAMDMKTAKKLDEKTLKFIQIYINNEANDFHDTALYFKDGNHQYFIGVAGDYQRPELCITSVETSDCSCKAACINHLIFKEVFFQVNSTLQNQNIGSSNDSSVCPLCRII